jgi:hypothetical protein
MIYFRFQQFFTILQDLLKQVPPPRSSSLVPGNEIVFFLSKDRARELMFINQRIFESYSIYSMSEIDTARFVFIPDEKEVFAIAEIVQRHQDKG